MWIEPPCTAGVPAAIAVRLGGIADDLVDLRIRSGALRDEVQWVCMAALRFRASADALDDAVRGLADDVGMLQADANMRAGGCG